MGTLVESKITNPIKMKACIVLIVLAVAVQAQKFEPAKCDYSKEIYCSGTWNEDWTEQITADFCIPMQNGDCWNYCPNVVKIASCAQEKWILKDAKNLISA